MEGDGAPMTTRPTDEDLAELIKLVWLAAKPGPVAQGIRATLSNSFDDSRFPQWAAGYIPEYVWDLVDIAAQRGIESR